MTACESVPSARRGARVDERPAPGRCRRRGRARSSGTDSNSSAVVPSAAMSGSVEVRRVHRGEARPERAGGLEHGGRGVAVGADAGLVLGRLLGDVRVERPLALGRPRGDGRAGRRVDRADAVDRGADARPGRVGELGDALAPRPRRCRRRSARCTGLSGSADAAVQVAGVEQGDADAGLARGGQHRRAELVGVGVRAPAGIVVQVVELADRRDARRAPSRRTSPGRGGSSSPGRGGRRPRTSARARSRSCRARAGCAREARDGRRASARWRTRAA